MRILLFVGTVLMGLSVGLLVAIGAGSSPDPFAAMSRSGAYLMILVAIFGGVFLSLTISASTERDKKRKEGGPGKPQDLAHPHERLVDSAST